MRGSPLSPHGNLALSFQQDLLAERTGIKSKSRTSRSPNLSPCMCVTYFLLCLCHPTLSVKALCFQPVCPSTGFVRPFVCSSIWTDLVTTVSHERLDQSRWNLQRIFTSPFWWPYYILEVKGQGHSNPSRWWRHLRWCVVCARWYRVH